MGGGERTLERHVENAEQATNRVVTEQRERVGQAVPARTQSASGDAQRQDANRRIYESMQRAAESISGLSAQRDTVRRHLSTSDRIAAFEMLRISGSPERAFAIAERGNERPHFTYRTEAEARAHSNEVLHEAQRAAPSQAESAPAQAPAEAKGFWASLWDGIVSVFDAIRDFFSSHASHIFSPALYVRNEISDAIISSNQEITREVSESWLSENYLGSTVRARFVRTPPVATTESSEFFATLEGSERRSPDPLGYGHGAAGIYYKGTNHITLSEREPERGSLRDPSEADRRRTNVHEQLHYASWLGGGHEMRWRDGQGRPNEPRHIEWLHEGLTELHAQQLTRSHGHTPTHVAYPYETATGFYIQQIVGEPVLRGAYLSGDFTEVRRRLDDRLGAGTFDRLAGMGSGLEALELITGRMSAAGIHFQAWERNPVLAAALQGVARYDAVR